MPTYKGVEVWIEDSEHRKITGDEVTNNFVDSNDRTVTVQTDLMRDERYTVHCRSPVSVLCNVFVITASRVRNNAASFYLRKDLATSGDVSGSSVDGLTEQFRDRGLRTPKRQFQQGKLGTVEVEIRRISEFVEQGLDEEEDLVFIMTDQPDQPPWLNFRFEISVRGLLAAPASTVGQARRVVPRMKFAKQSTATGQSDGTTYRMDHKYLCNSKKRPREDDDDESSSVIDSSELLQQEYQKEEAEEQRLLQKLEERLQNKRARNEELRRLLGETE